MMYIYLFFHLMYVIVYIHRFLDIALSSWLDEGGFLLSYAFILVDEYALLPPPVKSLPTWLSIQDGIPSHSRNTDLISVEKLLSTVDGIPSVPPSPPLGLGASAFALSPSLTDEVAGGDLWGRIGGHFGSGCGAKIWRQNGPVKPSTS